jgi:hypothetical protein
MPGRSIRIFLVDGIASGLRTAELGLSTIKALVVPRTSLSAAAKRPEVQRTGIYILIGRDSDKPGVSKIYFGEGDTVLTRLSAHDKDLEKDFWEEAVVFVSKDENLTKAHGRFLEARLINLAQQAKRCTVINATEPPNEGRLPEADEVEMEEFITQARLLMGTLGYDLFSPVIIPSVQDDVAAQPTSTTEFVYSGEGFSAVAAVDASSGQFVVRRESTARKQEAHSLQQTYKNLRANLVANGILADDNQCYRFTQDYAFTTPSPAAQVVSGQSINGRTAWKLTNSETTYAQWQDASLPDDHPSA